LNKKLTYKEIREYALNKYGESFSYAALSRHFNRHVESVMKRFLESERLRNKILHEQLRKDVKIAVKLTDNLEILSQEFEKVKNLETPEERKEAREIIGKINETISLLLKFSDKIPFEKEVDEEEIYERLLYAIEPLPPEYVVAVKERWEEYPKVKQDM
jgi:ribosomal protein L11 methylase PrmA